MRQHYHLEQVYEQNNYKQIKQFLNVQDYGLSDIRTGRRTSIYSKNDTPLKIIRSNINQYFGVPADEVELAIKIIHI